MRTRIGKWPSNFPQMKYYRCYNNFYWTEKYGHAKGSHQKNWHQGVSNKRKYIVSRNEVAKFQ